MNDTPLGEGITGYFEQVVSRDPRAEPWSSWWLEHEGELREKLSPGEFLRLKLAPHRELRVLLERERRLAGEAPRARSLFEAIERGELEAAQASVRGGVSVDSVDEEGESALYRAVEKGHAEIVGWLLAAGARDQRAWEAALTLPDGSGSEASGVSRIKLEIVERFLAHGEDANALFEDHMTPLMHAAYGTVELVALLLAHGAEVEAFDKSGLSPLDHAAKSGQRDIVERLVRD